jgi:lipopolysaccharide export system permease protein
VRGSAERAPAAMPAAVLRVVPTLDRYLMKESASHAGAAFVIVLVVFLVTRLSSLLGDATTGALPAAVVAELLALRTVMALPSLLPAVLYVGVLLALGRLSRDLELTAMEACGVSPRRVHRAVLMFAGAVALAIAVLSFVGRPWAAERFNDVRDHAVAASGLNDLVPGVFYELAPDTHEVLFAESRDAADPAYLANVFVQQRTSEGIRVFYAERARESRDLAAGFRFLTLLDGVQYELDPDSERQVKTAYRTLTLRYPIAPADPDLGPQKTESMWGLLGTDEPKGRAEFQWRSAMPVSAVLLCLLAFPLARTNPRGGQYTSVFVAVLLYMVYRTLLGTARSWVADGALPPMPGLWLVHAACLLTALGLGALMRRQTA